MLTRVLRPVVVGFDLEPSEGMLAHELYNNDPPCASRLDADSSRIAQEIDSESGSGSL